MVVSMDRMFEVCARSHGLATGTVGTLLVLLSFVYSFRRRKKILTRGSVKGWLRAHEWLSIAGAAILLLHSGVFPHALVPLLALLLMLIAVASGFIGRYLYDIARAELRQRRDELKAQGLAERGMEENVAVLAATSGTLARWRHVHMPLVFVLALTAVYHIVSALYYRGL